MVVENEKSSEDQQFLLRYFGGEEVEVITVNKMHVQTEKGEVVETNISYRGYLLDADKNFVYLGPDFDTVTNAIAKNKIIVLEKYEEVIPPHEVIPREKLN